TGYSNSNQVRDRPAFVQDWNRPLGGVMELVAVIDTEHMVHRRQHVLRPGGAAGGVFGAGIGAAYDLAHLEPAAGEDHGHGARPMVTAGGRDDAGGASELAVRDD